MITLCSSNDRLANIELVRNRPRDEAGPDRERAGGKGGDQMVVDPVGQRLADDVSHKDLVGRGVRIAFIEHGDCKIGNHLPSLISLVKNQKPCLGCLP